MANYDSYFLWLLDKIDDGSGRVSEYEELLWYLYNYDFTWILDHDSNRAVDGMDLRYEFSSSYYAGDKPCSVLEMLVALAHGWEHEITYDFHRGDRSSEWFWLMLENLGLLEIPDDPSFSPTFEKIIGTWLGRRFDFNGFGSPFPLKNPKRDQRKIEIWLQLQDFVIENVEI